MKTISNAISTSIIHYYYNLQHFTTSKKSKSKSKSQKNQEQTGDDKTKVYTLHSKLDNNS